MRLCGRKYRNNAVMKGIVVIALALTGMVFVGCGRGGDSASTTTATQDAHAKFRSDVDAHGLRHELFGILRGFERLLLAPHSNEYLSRVCITDDGATAILNGR